MASVAVLNWKKEKVGEVPLPSGVFEYPYRRHLVWEVVKAYLAGLRAYAVDGHSVRSKRRPGGASARVRAGRRIRHEFSSDEPAGRQRRRGLGRMQRRGATKRRAGNIRLWRSRR